MRSRTFTFEMLSMIVAAAATAASVAACGGKAVDDGGADGTSNGGSSGTSSSGARGGQTNTGIQPGNGTSSSGTGFSDCGPLQTNGEEVDESICRAQVVSTTSYHPASKCGDVVCAWSVTIPCSTDAGVPDADASGDAGSPESCQDVCANTRPPGVTSGGSIPCSRSSDGTATFISCGGCGVGRPPSGFVVAPVDAPTEEGAWLARMAQLEAASVEAFDALHDDLARHDAPDSLLSLVRIASNDEVRHARLAREQAERRGAIVPEVHVEVARGRSLEQLALENAREGCIEETFGAVLARIQADRATDPSLRDMLEGIARDELGHALLSWRIAEWLEARIADDARARVREARAQKLAELGREVPDEARPALEAIAPSLA